MEEKMLRLTPVELFSKLGLKEKEENKKQRMNFTANICSKTRKLMVKVLHVEKTSSKLRYL